MANGKSWISEHPWMTFFLAWIGISGGVQIAQIVFGRKTPQLSGGGLPRLPLTLPMPFQAIYEERLRRANAKANETRGVG